MRFLFWLAQTAITLLISGAAIVWMGPPYALVAVCVFLVCLPLLYENARQHSVVVDEPISALEHLGLTGTSILFGAIWPAIPVIIALRAVDARADAGG